jgi:hypothetical protein
MWTLVSNRYEVGVYGHVHLPWVVVSRPRCISSAIRASGGGGLAKRATTAFTIVAVLVVVAAVNVVVAVLLLFVFWLPPLLPLGSRDGVEGAGLAVGGSALV